MQEKLKLDSLCVCGCERKAWTVWRTVRGPKSKTTGSRCVYDIGVGDNFYYEAHHYIQWQIMAVYRYCYFHGFLRIFPDLRLV